MILFCLKKKTQLTGYGEKMTNISNGLRKMGFVGSSALYQFYQTLKKKKKNTFSTRSIDLSRKS